MTRSLHTLIHYLRHRIPHGGDVALTDAQLLERWVGRHDPAAFELMLWRHGPMVLNTCRRLLPRREDIEDAFQATFLVLVRKAGSIRRREGLAAWLHRVACRIACRARASISHRASREQLLAETPAAPQLETPAERELSAILDEEIELLPAHYRHALILCCLEGKSQEEAARLLNRPRGTVSSWLTRGRERLRQRLLRRGIVVSTAGLTAALTPDALSAGGMIPLIDSLFRMAGAAAAGNVVPTGLMSARSITLAEGVLRMMFMTKVKIVATICLVVAVAMAGVGTWSHTTRAGHDSLILNEEAPKEVRSRKPLPKAGRLTEPIPEAKVNVGDYIAWGEKAHGLQAGIAFRRGDQETYEIGQSVTFVVYLRNVSDKKINLSHIEPLFDEWMPVVVDAEGRRLAVAHGPINLGVVPITHRSVEAGQRITLGYPWFRIRPLDWRGEVLGPTCCAEPGRYKVGFTGLPLRLGDGKDISLSTKQVELNIQKREAAKEDHAAGQAPTMQKPVLQGVGHSQSLLLGNRLENFAQYDLNGNVWEYKRHRNGRLMLLDFWAHNCHSCLQHIHRLVELQRDYSTYGLEIVSIACETGTVEEQRSRVRAIRGRYNINYLTLLSCGPSCPVMAQFQVDHLPLLVLIDADGTIIWRSPNSGMDETAHYGLRKMISDRLVTKQSQP